MENGGKSIPKALIGLALGLLAGIAPDSCYNPGHQSVPRDMAFAASPEEESIPDTVRDHLIPHNDPLLAKLEVNKRFQPLVANKGVHKKYEDREGQVSWYHEPQRMADGEKFDPEKLVAAHITFPLGTIIRCTNLDNGKSTIAVIKDRGPYIDGRILDVSRAAARRLGMIKAGVTRCRIEVLAYPLARAMG